MRKKRAMMKSTLRRQEISKIKLLLEDEELSGFERIALQKYLDSIQDKKMEKKEKIIRRKMSRRKLRRGDN